MPDSFERVARPSSTSEPESASIPRGVSRNHLTMLLTIVGVVCAAAGAGVGSWVDVYRFHGGEQKKAVADAHKSESEAKALRSDERANEILDEYDRNPNSHPRLHAEIAKLRQNLHYMPVHGALSVYEEFAFAEFAKRVAGPTAERRKFGAETQSALAETQVHNVTTTNKTQDTKRLVHETESERNKAALVGIGGTVLYDQIVKSASYAADGDPSHLNRPRGTTPNAKAPTTTPTRHKID